MVGFFLERRENDEGAVGSQIYSRIGASAGIMLYLVEHPRLRIADASGECEIVPSVTVANDEGIEFALEDFVVGVRFEIHGLRLRGPENESGLFMMREEVQGLAFEAYYGVNGVVIAVNEGIQGESGEGDAIEYRRMVVSVAEIPLTVVGRFS